MTEPNSFCCISTHTCHNELVGLLLSLSIYHRNANVLCMVDSATKKAIDECSPKIRLNLDVVVNLDKYSGKNRSQMEAEGIWSDFQMMKSYAIEEAVKKYGDSLFLDSDMLIMDKLLVNKEKEIGVSPHYIRKKDTDAFGYYNGGMMWSRVEEVGHWWREYTKTSRYFDQASIEDLAKKYSYFEFDKSYNFSWWRVGQSDESPQQIVGHLSVQDGKACYDAIPIKIVHTHFNVGTYAQFNDLIKSLLVKANAYKELAIIDRIVDNKWTIMVPKQPMPYPWNHTNDSFREMVLLMNTVCKDVKGTYSASVKNVFLKSGICLYDRDVVVDPMKNITWFDADTLNRMKEMGSPVVYIGNGDIKEDVNAIKKIHGGKINGIKIYPWTYWVRNPITLAKKTRAGLGSKSYSERSIRSIFIGNVENSVQGKYRLGKGWDSSIDMYLCTQGTTAKFSQEEYLEKIADAKFGLSLRGYGAKCHREIELMACGTVPIIASEVCTDSYLDPLIEGVHYIGVKEPGEVQKRIAEIDEVKWSEMSKACKDWYNKNSSATGLWNTLISHILYES
jgi:hypothetical protein